MDMLTGEKNGDEGWCKAKRYEYVSVSSLPDICCRLWKKNKAKV